ncbi:DUF3021 family protein [Mollicutes bacterium LVI A0039]|nr:DUF3021 family protein [Mollicutes bacterium LVI A0039]
MRKFMEKALIGIAIAYLITTMYMLKYAVYYTSEELVVLYGIWATFGFVAGTTTMVYDLIENKIYATLCHFICLITFWMIAITYTIDVDISIMVIASIQFFLYTYLSIQSSIAILERTSKQLIKISKSIKNRQIELQQDSSLL